MNLTIFSTRFIIFLAGFTTWLFLVPISTYAASDILINEILPNPDSSKNETEWIEIYNSSTTDININEYILEDLSSSGSTNTYVYKNIILKGKSACYLDFSSKFNNDKDTITLKNKDGDQLDQYQYTSTIKSKSFSRIPDGENWVTNSEPSRNSVSCDSLITASPSPSPTQSSSADQSEFTITSAPSIVYTVDTINVKVQLSKFSANTQYYLKGAFAKPDTTNYFGKNKVSGNWIKNGEKYSSQPSITTDSSGNWSGNLEVMVDTEDSGFSNDGKYNLKIARYNSSGSGPDWSNKVDIDIKIKNPSPSPTPKPSPSSSIKPKASTSVKAQLKELIATRAAESKVAGVSIENTPLPDESVLVKSDSQINWPFILIGGLIFGGGAFLITQKYIKDNSP